MKELYIKHIAAQLQVKAWQVENCATMLEDGDTIPFISRYRKEKTGGMDDATVAEVKHWVDVFDEMETRKHVRLAERRESNDPDLQARAGRVRHGPGQSRRGVPA